MASTHLVRMYRPSYVEIMATLTVLYMHTTVEWTSSSTGESVHGLKKIYCRKFNIKGTGWSTKVGGVWMVSKRGDKKEKCSMSTWPIGCYREKRDSYCSLLGGREKLPLGVLLFRWRNFRASWYCYDLHHCMCCSAHSNTFVGGVGCYRKMHWSRVWRTPTAGGLTFFYVSADWCHHSKKGFDWFKTFSLCSG